jgi:hypothetical protein
MGNFSAVMPLVEDQAAALTRRGGELAEYLRRRKRYYEKNIDFIILINVSIDADGYQFNLGWHPANINCKEKRCNFFQLFKIL